MKPTQEQIKELLDSLSFEDVTTLADMACKKRNELEIMRIRQAEEKLIDAYKAFRTLAPAHSKYICWEYETNDGDWEEQDFDLYEMLDKAFWV